MCYVSLDFDKELIEFKENASIKDLLYKLPDQKMINLGQE